MYAFGQTLQILAQRSEGASALRKQEICKSRLLTLDNERFPAYYFELFGFDRDKGNLRKRVRELEEGGGGVKEGTAARGRHDVKFHLSPVREEVKERETEAFQTEEQQDEHEEIRIPELLNTPI